MFNSLYGGIEYPNSSFVFDKVYANYTEALEQVTTDSVLLGRYVLIKYCETAFSQDDRNFLEQVANGGEEDNPPYDPDAQSVKDYKNNYLIDTQNSGLCSTISYDRHVLRKVYKKINNADWVYTYEDIASLHSNLSDDSIAVKGLQSDEQILSINNEKILSSALSLEYNGAGGKLQLLGKDNNVISEINTSDFIADGIFEEISFDNENNTITFVWTQYDINTDTYETKQETIDLDEIIIQAIDSTKNKVSVYENEEIEEIPNGTNVGDTTIIKTLIADDKYSYTAYVWNGEAWTAMDGNYNADNVYFDEDMMVTTNIGYVTIDSATGQGIIPSAGKNLAQVFEAMFVEENVPNIEPPSILWEVVPIAGSYEVGTEFNQPLYQVKTDPGKYPFGPDTGVTFSNWAITSTNDDVLDSGVGMLKSFTVTEDTNYTITATVNHSEGKAPISNLGNEKEEYAITAGTLTLTSKPITGYREGFFYGSLYDAKDPATLTSADIRELSKSGAKYAKGSKTYTVLEGAAMIIFACPKTATGVINVLNTTVNANMNDAFGLDSPIVVNVNGANGYEALPYNVWIFTPAEPYSSTAELKITLG